MSGGQVARGPGAPVARRGPREMMIWSARAAALGAVGLAATRAGHWPAGAALVALALAFVRMVARQCPVGCGVVVRAAGAEREETAGR